MFDLDETLVRVQKDEPKYPYDTRINVVDQTSQTGYFVSFLNLIVIDVRNDEALSNKDAYRSKKIL